MLSFPLISCICITRGKPGMLSRVIRCFYAQSYQNKEMIIVYEEDDHATAAFVSNHNHLGANIQLVKIPAAPRMTLGALRNKGISAANGDFICQWDDDDWYHMNRLTCQYHAMLQQGADGSVLTRWLVFNEVSGKAYLSNRRLWEGSILCRKERIQQKAYENITRGEDTVVIEHLVSTGCLHLVEDVPELYIYVYHGGNTWHSSHWDFIFTSSTDLADKCSRHINDILNEEYSVETASLMLNELLEKEVINNRIT